MASQSFFDLECANRDVKVVAGRLDVTDGSGAVSTKFGLGWSIARTGTGVYRITLDKSYTGLLHASTMHYDLGGGTAEYAILVTNEDVAAATAIVDITCVVGSTGTPTDVPNGDDFSFCLYLLDGEVS
tara:strand:+ start:518 stop:901 length:384 start_codon:yes stop_codon:yes gene_type:complete